VCCVQCRVRLREKCVLCAVQSETEREMCVVYSAETERDVCVVCSAE